MATSRIRKPAGVAADELETKIAQELSNIETASSDKVYKAQVKSVYFNSAKEVEVTGGKKAIIIFVPVKLLRTLHSNNAQSKIVRELEKKFGGSHVVIIAQRTIMGENFRRSSKTQKIRPHSRTLTSVQEKILDDLVYPTEIVGKRTRCRVDGSKLLKVHLDPKAQVDVETKLETFASVYQKLTHHTVEFEFPVTRL